ncbi:SUMF1/EgtB/PvdO family nonheme iron enzyme [Oscillochloris sp. ZM17-4]|uniref:formylglycine-generating enzyme family protein n=1 Tax=Oscillochloris sp. ZM17-4 TaxID=2866714 RepID=UPI001C72D53A|nr:formylglycine-generating enzyme family protein [Oscillochloris sp. ZM17-4]MBX0331267.1 SUMF1/EgtB/PvdO family nonheme iron enzyme [Oscillochloris sp. ZM17-4]
MSSDNLQTRLTRLRRKLASETDPEEREDLLLAIEATEQRLAAQQTQINFTSAQTGDISIRDVASGDITSVEQQTNQSIGGEANVGAVIGRDVHGSINLPVIPTGVSGVGVATTLNQYFNTPRPDTHDIPPQAYIAAEVSDLRQQALLAYYQEDWRRAADLLARVVERDGDDAEAAQSLTAARSHLRLQDRYSVARTLRQAGEWRAVLGALEEIARINPQALDRDNLRTWAEAERERVIREARFGPVYDQVMASHYDEALKILTRRLAITPGDQDAIRATVAIIEDPTISVPACIRVASGELLSQYGDPRSGVCSLPPPMVPIKSGRFAIGISLTENEQIVACERANNLEQKTTYWYADTLNSRSMTVTAFELARYPVTNAQYKLFIDAGGYDPDASWWTDAARVWLAQDDHMWQQYQHKDQPKYWDDPRFGISRPNHPVVGVSWYEATAFCSWLTQYLNDNYEYMLLGEAEWEYAARGSERRIYPWGNATLDRERANFNQEYGGTTAVGCFLVGATPETGLLDMTGNVWEWTCSEYQPYPYDSDDGREDSYEPAEEHFTLRGGAWFNRPIYLRVTSRIDSSPGNRNRNAGFRVARRPLQVKTGLLQKSRPRY